MLTAISGKEYSKKMESDKKIFVKWLKKTIKVDGVIKGKDLAAKIGVDPSTISGYFTGKSKGPKLPLRLKICEELNVNHNEILAAGRQVSEPQVTQLSAKEIKALIAGEVSKYNKPMPVTDVTDMEKHLLTNFQKLVEQFEDEDKAYNINKDLAELENLDPESLKIIHANIRFLIQEQKAARAKE